MDDIEGDLFDRAWGLEPDSRLSCQCIIADEDLVIEIPKYTPKSCQRKPLIHRPKSLQIDSRLFITFRYL